MITNGVPEQMGCVPEMAASSRRNVEATAALLALFLVGCAPSNPDVAITGRDSWSIVFDGDGDGFTVPVQALVSNTGDARILLRECYDVDKRVDGQWVEGFTNNLCLLEMTGQEIAPGSEVSVSRDLREDLNAPGGTAFPHGPHGEFRIVFSVLHETGLDDWEFFEESKRTYVFTIAEP